MLAPLLLLGGPAFFSGDGRRHLYAGDRPAVLVFVRRECPISRKFAPELGRVARAFPRGRYFLVFEDPDASAALARSFSRDFALPWPGVLDNDGATAAKWGVRAVPTAIVLDRAGRVAYHGRVDDRFPSLGVQRTPRSRDLRDAVSAVLAGRRPKVARTPVVGCVLGG